MGYYLTIGEKFNGFTRKVAANDIQRDKDISAGIIKTEAEWKERYETDSNQSFDVLPAEWRILADKKDKTEDEYKRLDEMYREGFLQLGNSYVEYIDKKYGNGDGKLEKSEYIKYELSELPEEYKEFANPEDAENIFNHINIDRNDNIDGKEMAAVLSMFDMSVGLLGDKPGKINGKIKAVDMNANNLNLVKPSSSEDGKKMDAKIKGMYEFLFGSNK